MAVSSANIDLTDDDVIHVDGRQVTEDTVTIDTKGARTCSLSIYAVTSSSWTNVVSKR